MKLVIQTQHRENYGAHAWDGQGECPQYWKYKGGETYVFRGLTVAQAMSLKETGIPTLSSLIEQKNESWEEYILDWSIEDDNVQECAEWETPWDLSYDSRTGWSASRYVSADEYWQAGVLGKTEFYIMKPGGEREEYSCDYRKKAA